MSLWQSMLLRLVLSKSALVYVTSSVWRARPCRRASFAVAPRFGPPQDQHARDSVSHYISRSRKGVFRTRSYRISVSRKFSRQKHPMRSLRIDAAALGRTKPLGHLTKLLLPLADVHQEVHQHIGRPYSTGRTRPGSD